jgi:hypothetical protein
MYSKCWIGIWVNVFILFFPVKIYFPPRWRVGEDYWKLLEGVGSRGGHRHLQIGRMLDIYLITEPPHAPSPQM